MGWYLIRNNNGYCVVCYCADFDELTEVGQEILDENVIDDSYYCHKLDCGEAAYEDWRNGATYAELFERYAVD